MRFYKEDMDYNILQNITLKPEQVEAIDFTLKRLNCIVGLNPGLGKTIVGITCAYHIMVKAKRAVCFIICPKEANTAFKKELDKKFRFSYSILTTEEERVASRGRFFIFNYSNLDKMEDMLWKLKQNNIQVFAIFDEVHIMQSEDSNVSNRLRRLRNEFVCTIGLTATPLLNAMEGLWRVIDFIRPGFLGSYESFKSRYIEYRQRTVRVNGRPRKINEIVGYKNLDELREKLKDVCIIRGIKYDLDFQYKTCTLTEEEEERYKEAAKGILEDETNEKHIPARLHDLQRIADGSHHLLPDNTAYSKTTLLVTVLREILQRSEGALVYTEYEDTYKVLGALIEKYKGYLGYRKLYYITGKISYKKRVEVEQSLKAKDIAVITKAGCFARGTKVIMADGTLKCVEDIKVGDYVMGRGSIPRRVVNLHRGYDQMYMIRQSNAEDYIVNSQHTLVLQYAYKRSEFGFSKGDVLSITAEEFYRRTDNFKSHFRGFKEGYDNSDISLKINPYFLGLWIGDGDKYHPALYVNMERESVLAEQWKEYAVSLGISCREEFGGCDKVSKFTMTSGINGKCNEFTSSLREMGILANKRIPEEYFGASRRQRLELFAGIINTDGWAHRESLGVSTVIKDLAYDYKRLGDSLGYKTRISEYPKYDYSSKEVIGVVYNISFVGYFEDVPYLLPHKVPKVRRDFKKFNYSTIGIEKIGIGEYYGFEIEGPDKLFMIEDGTVVHNCKSINLQAVNNVVVYDIPFAIGDLIQLIGRVCRCDTTYETQHVYFLEVQETIDTYKRLLVQSNASLIKEVLGPSQNLPYFKDSSQDTMKKYRNYFKRKFLWKL